MDENKNSFKNCILLIYFNDFFIFFKKDFIKKIYGKYFKIIIFFSNFNNDYEKNDEEVTYVNTNNGFNTHAIFAVFYMKYKDLIEKSDGLMFAIDDCIINMTILNNYRNDSIIYYFKDEEYKSLENHNGWQWDKPYFGKDAFYRLFKDQDYINNFDIKMFSGFYADWFYIPKKYLTERFFTLCFLLAKHQVFFELAIPTLINYIEPDKNKYQNITDEILWGEDRNYKFANKNNLYNSLCEQKNFAIHPVRTYKYPIIKEWLIELFKS